ncbi:glycosyltransferase family 8 protein [Cylindrobasidium torrendii FP15055 ss-10]|uniref:Glycosyltransferase family 8 protein n=1 Tax=Cylindrobasidium torrendii FP15055 ss-10 TaxID=1314674 RepID=A0A0D7BB49_9AGAR|nr:glycosyltransferase family 8 protein [Cylindrobasidium torrendii FP15055 ss-10]
MPLRAGFLCLLVCTGIYLLFTLWPDTAHHLEAVECPQSPTPVPAKPVLEPIALTFVLLGPNIAHEGSVAIKSALMYSSRPLHFHLIVTEDNIDYLERKFALFDSPAYDVKVTYYPITTDMVRQRGERAGVGSNWPLLSKVFIHELLIGVKRVIFMDTDMIFVVDPVLLWNNFDDFNNDTLVSFPTLGPNSHAGEVCSCIMLMDLERMRAPEAPFMPSTLFPAEVSDASPATSAFAKGISQGIHHFDPPHAIVPFDPLNPFFADQGIYYMVWLTHPHLFIPLSQRWDVNFCRRHWGLKLGVWGDDLDEDISPAYLIRSQKTLAGSRDQDRVVSPGIIHYNCQPGAGDDVWLYEQNHSGGSHFGAMVTTALRYKWAWLNRGTGTIQTSTMERVRWWDERAGVGPSRGHGGKQHHH